MEEKQIDLDQTPHGSDKPLAVVNEKHEVLPSYEPCLICGGKAKGLHFQVTACRPCAVFYRRTIKLKRIYKCKKGTKNCELNTKGKGRPLCRYCRMQKCKEIGMWLVEEDLKDETDSHSASSAFPSTSLAPIIPNSSSDLNSLPTNQTATSSHLPQPHNHIYYTAPNECVMQSTLPSPPPRIEGNRLIYDCNPLIQAIKNILNQPPKSLYLNHGIHLSFMQQIQYSFSQFQSIVIPPPTTIIETLDEFDMDLMKFNETYILSLADMVMQCEQFAQLSFNDKYGMFKRFWPLFKGIERTFATTLLCGTSANDNRFLISDRHTVDFSSKSLTVKGFSQETLDKLKPYIESMLDKSTKFLLQPLKSLRITAFEVAYLSAYILWTVHGVPGLSTTTLSIADDIFEQCASDLHNYYQTIQSKKDFSTMAQVFDIFDCDLCKSELNDL